jgi:DNA (cytosine-5)-methyltransferase 1
MKNLEILDLYCGAGGFSFGFSEANPGFNIRLAIDNNEWAVQTFRQNHPSSQVIKADITKIHSLDILEMLNGKEPDIIIASPPCEAFSSANANRRKNDYDRLYSDETGRNLLHTIRIIKNLSPKFFFIENIKHIASVNMQEYIKQEFKGSGYKKIHFNMENALKYGIASFRKRVFISNIALPSNMSLKKKVTIRAAFKGLPDPFSFHSLKNHEILFPNRKMAKKIPKMKSNTALVYFQGSQKKSYRNYVKLPLNTFAPTVMGKSRFIHPLEHRLCTVREHARLMSYPDHFEFKGPQVWQFRF